jgi:hypothetical protein
MTESFLPERTGLVHAIYINGNIGISAHATIAVIFTEHLWA